MKTKVSIKALTCVPQLSWQLIWVPSSMIKTVVWWVVYFVAWITGNKKGWGRREQSNWGENSPLPLPFCTSQGGYVKKGLNCSLKNSLQRNMPASKQSRICRSHVKDVRLVQCQFSCEGNLNVLYCSTQALSISGLNSCYS